MNIKKDVKLLIAIISFVLFFALTIFTPIGYSEDLYFYFSIVLKCIVIIIALYCFIDLIQSLRKLVKLKEEEIQNKIEEDKKD